MKIFNNEQIREIDSYTIQREPVASIDLMERAAGKIYSWLTRKYGRSQPLKIFAGSGNNGGDGLALARMLTENGYSVETYCLNFSERTSADWKLNRNRLENLNYVKLFDIERTDQMPVISSGTVLIDAIFGSGLTRTVDGLNTEIIKYINQSDSVRISIDIPSGLFCENNNNNDSESIIRADYTLSLQFPKLAFMFPENAQYVGDWQLLPIGLDNMAIRTIVTPYIFLENSQVLPLIKKRKKFDHKGTLGHGLIISGSYGKIGAAILCAGAALRTGIGLLTCQVPMCGNDILQGVLPEAMVRTGSSDRFISAIGDTENFSAVGMGPGLGTAIETQNSLKDLLAGCKKPLILDADALNILSMNKQWISLLPERTILTPHIKEFERLAGTVSDGYSRLQKQIEFSKENSCIVILKGAHTSISVPSGIVFFNSTGNPGMATAGSGDVLTGIILSLLSQGYTPENAAITGVYLHGLAGDLAAVESSFESIIASDIIKCIGKAFNKIRGF